MQSKTPFDALIRHYAGARGKQTPTPGGYRRTMAVLVALDAVFVVLVAANTVVSGFAANAFLNVVAILVAALLSVLAVRTAQLLRREK